MIGVKPGVKNDLGYSFGLNGIQEKWRALGLGDDFRTLLFCNPGETIIRT